ncbi:MAG: ABC transporter ATP-binding protein [Acidobacteria bacterium]|nr:ABC transporter ATP-binding protein [Acidobacteriota bacterium]
MIQLENVTKNFDGPNGKVTALNDISLALSAGEMLVINGHSGCGKSTLLLTAAGMLRPDSGNVRLLGKYNPYDLNADQRSRMRAGSIGFVFQQFHLIPYLTVRENILTPLLSLDKENPDQRTQALIEQFGLKERSDHVPSQLSTGERQRTALARAVFNQPQIIFADEPTGNLDEDNAEIVLKHLRDYVSAGGSVLLVTHHAKAAEYATRILKMKNGRLENN